MTRFTPWPATTPIGDAFPKITFRRGGITFADLRDPVAMAELNERARLRSILLGVLARICICGNQHRQEYDYGYAACNRNCPVHGSDLVGDEDVADID
jgi:hypothetical protein